MIGYLSGIVKAVIRDTIIVSVDSAQGAIGYRVHVPTVILAGASEGDAVALWTHMAVRENAHDLYGFETREELSWFELLLTVSSIGPRSALSIMNSADIKTLSSAITGNDASVLARAFGIGRKTAEKIVLELKDKVESDPADVPVGSDGEVVEALMALGYAAKEARDAARAIPKDIEGTEDRVREALRIVSGGRK